MKDTLTLELKYENSSSAGISYRVDMKLGDRRKVDIKLIDRSDTKNITPETIEDILGHILKSIETFING